MRIFALVALVAILGCGGGVQLVNSGGERCGALLNTCTRVTCTLENTGGGDRDVDVTYRVLREDGSGDKFTETVAVKGGEMKTVTHDFKGAKLLSGDATTECVVD